jgi:hypothetical protein
MMKPFAISNKIRILGILILLGLFLFPDISPACDTKITVKGDPKKQYQPGDEVILKVTIFLPHKDCDVPITDTKFKVEGLTVLGATKWKLNSPGLYERLIKIKINATERDKSVLHVQRVCKKEGGYGAITLKTQP